MALDAIFVEFAPAEDRLLVRVQHDRDRETRFWFTRRLVRMFWPVLLKLAAAPTEIRAQASPEARKALVEMRHEQAISGMQFTQGPAKPAQIRTPSAMLLVTTIHASRKPDGRVLLTLCPPEGPGWDLNLSDELLHALIELIRKASASAEWELGLDVPRTAFGTHPGASN